MITIGEKEVGLTNTLKWEKKNNKHFNALEIGYGCSTHGGQG
jgi:hypothetical protein